MASTSPVVPAGPSNAESAGSAQVELRANKARPYLILAVILGLALGVYLVIHFLAFGKESTDDAQVDADAVTISARVGAAVQRVPVSDNQAVKQGDLLVELDTAMLTATVKEGEAELQAARAQANAADAQVRIVEAMSRGGLSAAEAQLSGVSTSIAGAAAQVDAARAALERARAEASRADTDLTRAEALRKDEAIPLAQVDAARATANAARAAVAQADAQLAAASDTRQTALTRIAEAKGHVEQSAPVDAQLAAARANADLEHARVDAADAALNIARLNLSYARILAPNDGVLSRLSVREGQLVQPGQQVVVLVPSTTYTVANFKETQVGSMRPGQRAEISVDAFPGRSFEGRVESASPGTGARFSLMPPDNATGNFVKVVQRVPVKITWVNVPPDVRLAAGMSADVTVLVR